ncbi:hypothetical protein GJ744_005185 [Endocarpon pusillum]|uniref:Uncharacterized protein n=1 Tax=Endocarpon pusillum TaxID=364733 RepID=A0A8H7DZR5_9EURO|nr:hypothetical protein GJ744_005185 [Endocarpon pusillum]
MITPPFATLPLQYNNIWNQSHINASSDSCQQCPDACFDQKMVPDDAPEDGCHPDEVQALQDYYHKRTSTNEAAKVIRRPVEYSRDPYGNLYRLWALLVDALVKLPATQILIPN